MKRESDSLLNERDTLANLSKDDNSGMSVTNSRVRAIDFDKVKEQYAGRSGVFPLENKVGRQGTVLCLLPAAILASGAGGRLMNYAPLTPEYDAAAADLIRTNLKAHHLDIPGIEVRDHEWTTIISESNIG